MKEFFGWGGYTRQAEGFLSWQHLMFVTFLMGVMVALAVLCGMRTRHKGEQAKNRVLMVAAVLIDSLELFKIVLMCIRGNDPWGWLYELPLFLCSLQLIAIPLAAFSKGRIRQAALDFVLIFGVLGAVLGTYGAGQNYGCYPVISFDNVMSGLTHSISGFSSIYIGVSGLTSLKKRNIPITFCILFAFSACASIANWLLDYNYMFLVRPDGTPYELLFTPVKGNAILYGFGVVLLFVLYISAFYGVYFLIKAIRERSRA